MTRIVPRSATDAAGANVLGTLGADDDSYPDFPTRRDFAHIEYPAPPLRSGAARTIFAETRGWYEVHMHRTGPPDLAAIARLTNEPGFVVRRGLHDYARFRRTGQLAGVEADTSGAGMR